MKLRTILAALLLLAGPALAADPSPIVATPTAANRAANKAYVDTAISGKLSDAPGDGTLYGRKNGAWTAVPAGGGTGGIAEAPTDGSYYIRLNAGWASIPVPIGDAPNNATQYVRQGGTWVANSSGLGYTPVNKAGDTLTGALKLPSVVTSNNAAGTAPACSSLAGAFYPDVGGNGWVPSCWGTWNSATPTIEVNPTRATANPNKAGVPFTDSRTASLSQVQSDGNQPYSFTGRTVNLDVVGGSWSNSMDNSQTPPVRHNTEGYNAVGNFISVRQRPGPNGEMPYFAWGNNTDIRIESGAGDVETFGHEYDMTNFNKDCYIGASCLATWLWFNGTAGHPMTSYIYASTDKTQVNQYVGTVKISNGVITRNDGDVFTSEIVRMRINNSQIIHVQYVDANHMNAIWPIPLNSATALPFTADTSMVHVGILFASEYSVADHDMAFNDSALNGLTFAGQHYIGVNLAGDQANYAVVRRRGMNDCYNSLAGCFVYDLASPFLSYNNGAIKLWDNGTFETAGPINASGKISAITGMNVAAGQGLCLNGAAGCFAYNAGTSSTDYAGTIKLYDNGTLTAGPTNTAALTASGKVTATTGINIGAAQGLCLNGAISCFAYNSGTSSVDFNGVIKLYNNGTLTAGPITGTSLSAGTGAVTGGAISGTSLSAGTAGTVTGGAIKFGPTTYGALPGCSPANDGLEMYIKDAPSNPAWHGAAAGGGTTPSKVMCMSTSGGSAWLYN